VTELVIELDRATFLASTGIAAVVPEPMDTESAVDHAVPKAMFKLCPEPRIRPTTIAHCFWG
jgi:hypothetical protein